MHGCNSRSLSLFLSLLPYCQLLLSSTDKQDYFQVDFHTEQIVQSIVERGSREIPPARMSDEQVSLRYLSLDGTCDVGRSVRWSEEEEEGTATLDTGIISWDKTAVHRCLGYPPELIQSSFEWWSEKIHPDDRLRVIASLERALFQSQTARYWSETYRLRLYDSSDVQDGDAVASSTAAAHPASSSSTAIPSMMISSGTPPVEEEVEAEESKTPTSPSTSDASRYPLLSASSTTSRSSTPRQQQHLHQLPQLATSSSSSPASSEFTRDERGNNINNAASARSQTATHRHTDDSKYVTVLDQLYISRAASSSSSSRPAAATSQRHMSKVNSSQPHDRMGDTEAESNTSDNLNKENEAEKSADDAQDGVDGQEASAEATTTTPTPSSSQQQHRHRPTSAIGSIFALEQRIKTSEALHDPRSRLMRSISNLSASSNASSSAATSSSNNAPPSSSDSFVSVPSSAGAMQRQQQQQQQQLFNLYNPNQYQQHQQPQSESIQQVVSTPSASSSSHPPPWVAAHATNTSPVSPVSSPGTTHKAFSFLDVEGVRTILENTQSGLTMVDAKGRPTYLNAAGANITGYSGLDDLRLAGSTLHHSLHHTRPDGREYPSSECPIVRSMATLKRVANQPDTFFRKDGSSFPVVWSCSPISKLGKSIGAVLEFRDVTEEKALEKDKLKATLMNKHQEITIREANASKQRMTQFLDYIAHELRNPLHGIAANIEFLRDSLTALQSSFDTMPALRPTASPLQQPNTVTTPSQASGSLLSSNSQSSSFRSSSATSSLSSQRSISKASSPRLDFPTPTNDIASALSSAVVSAQDLQASTASLAASTSSSSSATNSSTTPIPRGRSPHGATPRALAPVTSPSKDVTPSATLDRETMPIATGQHASLQSAVAEAAQNQKTQRYPLVETSASIDDAAQREFQAHFEPSSSRGPPPWQAEDHKIDSTGGAMALSPLLVDITKHTATANALAKQQNELVSQKSGSQSGSQGSATSSQPNLHSRKATSGYPGPAKDDLKGSSPASPSPSAATVLESEAGAEHPQLSNSEIQQVLQTSQSFITSIRECVFHATHITNNVLDLSRFEAGKVELLSDIVYPARVATLAVDMMMARAQEKEIELKLDIPEDQILVRGDGTRLAQVFLNLLSNAIKFTPRGGQVTLRFKVSQENGRILLHGSIIDTGMGMSKEEMSNLFQRFGQSSRAIQAEYGGTGLGLSICQEIVTLQGGKMSVESEKGHGSTFSFTAYYQPASEEDVKDYLRKTPGQSRRGSVSPIASPISEPGEATGAAAINAFIPTLTATITGQTSPSALPEEQQARLNMLKAQLEAEQADREPFRFKHILVAEDNGINQNIMKTYLKKLGYHYTIVNNGQEVLDTFVNKTHEPPIDVILMDCEMPVMDGRQATDHIRQHEHFRKNLVTPLDSPFNLQLGAAEINNLQATPPSGITTVSYSPPLSSPTLSHTSSPGLSGRRLHRTPIIGLSGNARQELVSQALASGMDDYVVKPFKLAELEKVLKKWEKTIDEQLVQRNVAVKAKEFLSAATATAGTPVKSKKVSAQLDDLYRSSRSTRNRSGSGSSKSDATASEGTISSSSGGTSSPRPIRPPLLSSLSASRLPREHMLGYGSPERATSRPKLPSRLSNEWIHQASQEGQSSTPDQKYTFPPARPRMAPITSEPDVNAAMSPLLESPAPSPSGQVDETSTVLAPSLLQDQEIRPAMADRASSRESLSSPRKSI
ncbi:hypothetical protein P389DRAFT_86410 [Cystobasidium minutum MCA 4210]|uniref:uncharacterized protein n=1 Tax=Cystobasidium minutum MCA 4210 TaxID=1397322 RepID=UPI0034CD4BB4|eukprot:jgi/Rhomi1/86410/CE86409_18003